MNKRCEKMKRLREYGLSWSEVAERLGYKDGPTASSAFRVMMRYKPHGKWPQTTVIDRMIAMAKMRAQGMKWRDIASSLGYSNAVSAATCYSLRGHHASMFCNEKSRERNTIMDDRGYRC